jgi:hypothetical protein
MFRPSKQLWLWGAMLAGLLASAAAAQSLPPERHRTLQNAVDAACSVPRSCNASQSCATLQANYDQHIACATARETINNACFRGGDSGHREAARNERNGAQRCSAILVAKKCKNCP